MADSEKLAKKKKWITIVAKEFKNQQIGETLVLDAKNLINKKLYINLMSLTGNVKSQNVNVGFKISEVKDSNALAEVISYNLSSSYIKRLVGTDVNKIDDSFICESKDKVKLRFKPLIQTKFKAHNKTLKDIRKRAREFLIENTKKQTYDEVVFDVIYSKLQKNLFNNLKKIYPLSTCEFRIVERI